MARPRTGGAFRPGVVMLAMVVLVLGTLLHQGGDAAAGPERSIRFSLLFSDV